MKSRRTIKALLDYFSYFCRRFTPFTHFSPPFVEERDRGVVNKSIDGRLF